MDRAYLLCAKEGRFEPGKGRDLSLKTKSKKELFALLEKTDKELVEFLAKNENLKRTVVVKWSHVPIPVVSFFWVMNDHEILHNGINIAFMDHLGMERFEELKRVWG